ncbi:uncharacterized protein N7529_000859 [Penicillium soppii]|uniref:uncharacterized protein n=1 Tax=Penicillium soppii TaxID=69789 RepID=UPI002548D4B6|nr:uncharacterized protein N7529_000859 [Penicillium soppii]KAJ5882187.1 hypothetical protein N7529_000859 [Penicillium soppii]
MAKSIRASVSKRNRATLRKNFFGPIVDARTERLHAKLQELADKPKPEAPAKSKRELAEQEAAAKAQLDSEQEMDVDAKPTKSMKKPARVQKRNQKPRNSIVFKKRVSSGKGTSYRGSSKK